MASLSAFIGVLKRELFSVSKKTSLKTLLTILIVFALEKMLTATNTFKCPKKGYQVYGGMFLFVPAFCLSGLTLLTTSSFWNSATSRLRGKYGHKIVCSNICSDLAKAVLVGVTWLVLAFGTTDFYVCFRVGATESKSRRDEMQAQSTIVAWATLILIITSSLLYNALTKHYCSRHHMECTIQTLPDYERLETEAAVSKYEEEVQLLAEKQGEKQVMDILGEVKDGKDAHEVVKKAKNMLLAKYSKMTQMLGNGCAVDGRLGDNEEPGETQMLITTV